MYPVRRRVKGGVAQERRADMEEIARLVEAGDLRAVIDSRYALSDIARAYDRVAPGRHTHTCSLRGNQRLKVHEVQNRRLQDLALEDRTGDTH